MRLRLRVCVNHKLLAGEEICRQAGMGKLCPVGHKVKCTEVRARDFPIKEKMYFEMQMKTAWLLSPPFSCLLFNPFIQVIRNLPLSDRTRAALQTLFPRPSRENTWSLYVAWSPFILPANALAQATGLRSFHSTSSPGAVKHQLTQHLQA